MYIDRNGDTWYRGNLHLHTSRSDGKKPPEEAISLYRENGYDFLALTDHWAESDNILADGFLLLSGCEYNVGATVQEGIYHIVGIGMQNAGALERKPGLKAQEVIDSILDRDGVAILAHPAWSINQVEEIQKLDGLVGLEIYNTVSAQPWNSRPYSGTIVDSLAARGKRFFCMAADDTHHYNGDECVSYLMVRAKELSRDAIMGSIRRGDFYATQGPRLSVRREGGEIIADCSPVSGIVFNTDTVWVPDRVFTGEGICTARYRIKPTDTFVRVEATDSEGKTAWSSPLFV